jgi:hypothetical protein
LLLYCKAKWTQILTAATWQWVDYSFTQRSFQLKFLSKRFWCDFYLIIFLNGINWLKQSHRKTQNIC